MGKRFLLPKPLDVDEDVVKVIKPFSMEDNKKYPVYHKEKLILPKMWKEMENCVVVPKRSWSGLRSRFNNVKFPNIET